jgi:hypothetical protein
MKKNNIAGELTMRRLASVLLLSACISGPAMAQSMTIDLSKMPPEVSAAVLKAQQDAKGGIKPPSSIEEAEKYADFGKHVAEAISATAKGLSIEVNDFVKTPVGTWAFVFVFWYFLGHKIWAIFGGVVFWIALNSMLWKSYRHFLMEHQVLKSTNGTEKVYEYQSYDFKSRDAKTGCAWAHTFLFVLVNLSCMLIIF